jgi:hypothetical protein
VNLARLFKAGNIDYWILDIDADAPGVETPGQIQLPLRGDFRTLSG